MSRTKKGHKSPGYDYWSKRPYSGFGFGKVIKRLTHRKERRQSELEINKLKKFVSTLALLFFVSTSVQADFPTFVRQANIFLGEVASNLTIGAPLVVSSTGKVSTGINFNEITSTANITTTSATDVLLTGVTFTPSVASVWQCLFSTWLIHSNGNATITMSYYVGGVQSTNSVRSIIPFVGALSAITQDIPVTMHGIFTVNGSQAIAIEWHTSTGTATAHQLTYDCVRLQ